jgi:dihydroorotate dehydrogenase
MNGSGLYGALYRHVFSRLEAERAHHLALAVMALAVCSPRLCALIAARYQPDAALCQGMETRVFSLPFAHPLGLAAGFDKDARAVQVSHALGFSFQELGTVTPQPQPGNAAPRLFRLPADRALINRLGFPSAGAAQFAANLARVRQSGRAVGPIAVSLGKNKETPLSEAAADYAAVLRAVYAHADLFVVNISSPNTPELRRLQDSAYLDDLLGALRAEMLRLDAAPKPLLLKIAPDLTEADLDTLIEAALRHGVSGIVAANTTTARDNLRSAPALTEELGGLSGAPLRARSTEIVRHIYVASGGALPIIGVGGIFSGQDVWEKLCAGATLTQAYTGFIYGGPGYVRRAVRWLRRKMDAEGVRSLSEIVGSAA